MRFRVWVHEEQLLGPPKAEGIESLGVVPGSLEISRAHKVGSETKI